jgi:hypothetical protein
MYSGNSEEYWKRSKKSNQINNTEIVLLVLITILLGFTARAVIYPRNDSLNDHEIQRLLEENVPRPQASSFQYNVCESNMRDALRTECDSMCTSEAQSLPRPTMYRSCHHGCSRAFYSAAIIGCKNESEIEAHSKMNREANNACSRYMNIEPRPEVQSTCRKYYREGTKQGHKIGSNFINNLVDIHWEEKKDNYLKSLKRGQA